MATVILPGQKRDESDIAKPAGGFEDIFKIKSKAAVSVGAVRGESSTETFDGINDDDVIEIELEDGTRLWQSVADAREDFRAEATRGDDEDALLVPRRLAAGGTQRGLLGTAIKGLKIFGIDPVDSAAEISALALAKKIEGRIEPGLYKCTAPRKLNDEKEPIALAGKFGAIPTNRPVLLFIHGTASSTNGSFSGLANADNGVLWKRLSDFYGGHIYALEHQTFSRSPLENVQDLMQSDKLPKGVDFHLVSHSRGGIVGEVLCRACRKVDSKNQYFDDDDFANFKANADDLGHDRSDDIKAMKVLNTAFAAKQIKVTKFVRVACPARGTLLASERIDRYLSLLLNIIAKVIPAPVGTEFFDIVQAFLLAFIKTRADPSAIPGLEAQMPGSPLVQSLNRADITLDGELSVIAGDVEGSGLLGRAMIALTDAFYREDHDLVVNSKAMTGGAQREPGDASQFLDRGAEVNHFNYFKNHDTRTALADALIGSVDDLPVFKPFPQIAEDKSWTDQTRSDDDDDVKKPMVFVLPGILGSHLGIRTENVKDLNRIWLDPSDIVFGRLKKLKGSATNVEAEAPFGRFYNSISNYLSSSHRVIQFPYDWRLSLASEAVRLGELIRAEVAKSEDQPIRILAHSMGGLLARAMFAQMPDIHALMHERKGSRFVMLGTPNNGSHSIVSMLLGRDKSIRMLALADMRNSLKEVLEIVGTMPGPFEMLPVNADRDYFSPSTWDQLAAADSRSWVRPKADILTRAKATRALIDSHIFDPDLTCYVAGIAEETPIEVEIDASASRRKRIKLLATADGDGRVPWAGGIPETVPHWYMNVSHGDLPSSNEGFDAIFDLLSRGKTDLLAKTPPARRDVQRGPREASEQPIDMHPDIIDLERAMMGAESPSVSAPTFKEKIKVSIAHGDLRFARYPVVVGHYLGDPLMGAEWDINVCLEGRLAQLRSLGLYPGKTDTCDVILDRTLKPEGAIIIGLGRYGELWPNELTDGFSRAMLRYSLKVEEYERAAPAPDHADRPLGVSSLLIGQAGSSRLSTRDSIESILNGAVAANKALNDRRIEHVQFVELFEDTAIQAATELQRLARDPRFMDLFEIEHKIDPIPGKRRRENFAAPIDWWQRITVRDKSGEGGDGGLEFVAITETAKATESLLAYQRRLTDRLIQGSRAQTTNNRDIGRLLFEMLVPRQLKSFASDERNLLFAVDERTAEYPWELMDPSAEVDPDRPAIGGTAHETKPISVRAPVIRQLIQPDETGSVTAALGKGALVVGDPKSEMADLPGAQREADLVQTQLSEYGFDTTYLDKPESGLLVLRELMLHQRKIVHLAGHGVFRHEVPRLDDEGKSDLVTGMVIGDNVFLTAAEIANMRYVPEFVFINCCHLGRMGQDGAQALWNGRHRLAASLATQFIKSGAHAVIAAGWAVDDEAALTFSDNFYARMLAGESFGEATFQARVATYDLAPHGNTWGAYQCYGDPDYSFVRPEERAGSHARRDQFAAVSQAITVAQNIVEAANSSKSAESDLHKEIDDLIARIPQRWMKNAELRTVLGEAWTQVDEFDLAMENYRAAIAAGRALAPIRAFEQLANLEILQAVATYKRAEAANQPNRDKLLADCKSTIEASVEQLKSLSTFVNTTAGIDASTAPNVERHCLLGSAYKRLAVISDDQTERNEALDQMADAYRTALRPDMRPLSKAKKEKLRTSDEGLGDRISPYPGLNWLAALTARDLKAPRAMILHRLDLMERYGRDEDLRSPSFWNAIIAPEVHVLKAIADPNANREELETKILLGIKIAWRRGGSFRQARSAMENLNFLIEILKHGRSGADAQRRKDLHSWLVDLHAKVSRIVSK